ncbi:MAG: prenyltransferase/squalene oxidase repeat-containing protein [Phycisphaeraceae bacterium]
MPIRRCCLSVILVLAMAGLSLAADAPVVAAELKAAVAKALPPLKEGALGHRDNRSCFACHNQALPIMAMTAARQRGLTIDADELKAQLQFIADFLAKNRAAYLEGKGQGGQADTAGYALVTLQLGGWKADETTAAVTHYLLLRNADLEHWRANSQRPPSEGGNFTTTYVALRGLTAFRTAEQQEPFIKRRDQVRSWLIKTPAKDNEDRVFRLLGLKLAEADVKEIEAAAAQLKSKQRDDGGWAQLDKGEPESATGSDAYATGSALVALHQAGGLDTSDAIYQRGLRYLLKTQQADGTWHVATRSKPIQKYFETGFPHGKDQFISSAATGWAATALTLAIEEVKASAAGD